MKKFKGVTTVELLAAVVLLGIIILTISLLIKSGINAFVETNRITAVICNQEKSLYGSASLKGILWEIRLSSAVSSTQSDRLILISTYNANIEYYKSSDELLREDPDEIETISDNIAEVLFKYYGIDGNGLIAQTTNQDQVDFISIDLKFKNGEKTHKVSSLAKLRNK